jgi:hypothetical protein
VGVGWVVWLRLRSGGGWDEWRDISGAASGSSPRRRSSSGKRKKNKKNKGEDAEDKKVHERYGKFPQYDGKFKVVAYEMSLLRCKYSNGQELLLIALHFSDAQPRAITNHKPSAPTNPHHGKRNPCLEMRNLRRLRNVTWTSENDAACIIAIIAITTECNLNSCNSGPVGHRQASVPGPKAEIKDKRKKKKPPNSEDLGKRSRWPPKTGARGQICKGISAWLFWLDFWPAGARKSRNFTSRHTGKANHLCITPN